ncbi:MAG: DUF3131 domain-containing protein [Actinomycetota bacterium]|nr:DUF3131 domain-containing protein [Actinomycetota bacterium]
MHIPRPHRLGSFAVAAVLLAATFVAAAPADAHPGRALGSESALSAKQRAVLYGIAKDTWKFFQSDVDPNTHLPLDNLGPGQARGSYTSAANIGVYLWSVVSAKDLKLISRRQAVTMIKATLQEVRTLKRSYGFLYQWYDTGNGHVIKNPGDVDCSTETTPAQDNCYFLSAVDNGWYASGLMVTRQALPELRGLVNRLMAPMDFSIFYDNRPQTNCNTNPAIPGNQPTGQQYGGYYVDQGPAPYHNGALYSDPRISIYIGMGLHQMPGDVWWRTWRTLPPKRCATDPDFSWQGQAPGGYWKTYRDPQSGKKFPVWEGKYTYPGTSLDFIPTFGGGMFEGLMANEVVPETQWGKKSFGLADRRTAQVQIKYATEQLHYPVWGLSPSSTADDTGGYATYGVEGLTLPKGHQLSQCVTCASETTVTPHASFLALSVLPQQAYRNIVKLRRLYPDSYTRNGGFYDAVNPTTGAVGHRRLVLDQSMIMAALDNALNHNALQRYFGRDPAAWAAHTYLSIETMAIAQPRRRS